MKNYRKSSLTKNRKSRLTAVALIHVSACIAAVSAIASSSGFLGVHRKSAPHASFVQVKAIVPVRFTPEIEARFPEAAPRMVSQGRTSTP